MVLCLVRQQSVYIYVITGILAGLTKIKGEPSIVIFRVRVCNDAGRKDNKRSKGRNMECDIEALLRET